MLEYTMVRCYLTAWLADRQQHRGEEGASVVEFVIITGLVAAAAIAIVAIVMAKFKNKATGIPTG